MALSSIRYKSRIGILLPSAFDLLLRLESTWWPMLLLVHSTPALLAVSLLLETCCRRRLFTPATTLDRKREIPAGTARRWYNLTIRTKSFRFSIFFFLFWFQTPYKPNSSDKIKTKTTSGKHFLRREYAIENRKKESEEAISKCSQTRTCPLLQYEIVEGRQMNSCSPNQKKKNPNIFLKKSQKSKTSQRTGSAKKFVIRTPRNNRQSRISKNRESSRKKMAMGDTSSYQNSNCSNPT